MVLVTTLVIASLSRGSLVLCLSASLLDVLLLMGALLPWFSMSLIGSFLSWCLFPDYLLLVVSLVVATLEVDESSRLLRLSNVLLLCLFNQLGEIGLNDLACGG